MNEKAQKPIILQPPPALLNQPRATFDKDQIEALVAQKGYDVYHESGVKCPCRSKDGGNQPLSNCKNCGASGYVYLNKIQTRMVLHSMNLETKHKEWSENNLGRVSITARDVDKLCVMDRITVIDGESLYSEILRFTLEEEEEEMFSFTCYDIQSIAYIAMFLSTEKKLKRLTQGEDYEFEGNIVVLNKKYLTLDDAVDVTIKYVHRPQYYVIDIGRDVMNTFIFDPKNSSKEINVKLPINAIGRRAHFVLDGQNFKQNRIFDNSYNTDSKTCQHK